MAIIYGTGNADLLYGTSVDDTLYGYEGNDYLYSSDGEDIFIGGLGNDLLFYNNQASIYRLFVDFYNGAWRIQKYYLGNIVNGIEQYFIKTDTATEVERIIGSANVDNIEGSANADILDGSFGADNLWGYGGNDILYGGNDSDGIDGGDGNDVIYGGKGADILRGGAGNDVIFMADAGLASFNDPEKGEIVYGDDGDDLVYATNGFDEARGGGGIDTMDFTYILPAAAVSLNFASNVHYVDVWSVDILQFERFVLTQNDDFFRGVNVNGHFVDGRGGNDVIEGTYGNDTLYGGTGNDTIDGYYGNDNIRGDAGDDILNGEEGNDTLNGGSGVDIIDGGNGTDTLNYDGIAVSNGLVVDMSLTTGRVVNDGFGFVDEISNIEQIIGSALADTITGSSSGDHLWGMNGNDVLSGGGGDDEIRGYADNDTITGGAGNDYLLGGTGNDTYHVTRASQYDSVREYANEGTDKIMLASDIAYDQLWFTQTGNDLDIMVLGETDVRLRLHDVFSDASARVESIQSGDGKILSFADFDDIIAIYDDYTQPGGTDLPQNMADVIGPLIDALWQTVV